MSRDMTSESLPNRKESATSNHLDPDPKSFRRARNDEKWDSLKEEIYYIYMTNNSTLQNTKRVIEEKHGFKASERKWKGKLKEWRFDKNISASDLGIILLKAEKRAREGKETVFFHGETLITGERIEQFKRRRTVKESGIVYPNASTCHSAERISGSGLNYGEDTPKNITYHTPRTDSPELTLERIDEKDLPALENNGLATPECIFPSMTETPRSFLQKSGNMNTEPMVGVDALEGAGTLSSMDSQRRIIQFQDDAYQSIPQSTPSGSKLSQDSKGEAVESNPMDCISMHSMNNAMLDIDDSSLADFLRDVMMPTSPNSLAAAGSHSTDFINQSYCAGRNVFNSEIESSLDYNEIDFGWITSQNEREPAWNYGAALELERATPVRETATPDVSTGIRAGAEAFERSIWRWEPDRKDHAHAEQFNLSLPYKDMHSLEPRHGPDVFDQTLEQISRDQILAMLLRDCEPSNISCVVACFPPAELLDSLMHSFRSEVRRTDSWIHLPTFRAQSQRPELNAIVVAAGAVLSGVPALRKLGFAMQEAVRLAIPTICEIDNSTTRELQIVQAHALELDVGMWSGNKRKMENAEYNSQPLVTRLRRAGHYRRKAPTPPPLLEDDATTLESKWRAWVEAESFKRLAFHTLIHDAQASICLLTRPLVSYSEISLDLPYSLALWRAKTAMEWRDVYLRKLPNTSDRLPSLMHCIHDMQLVSKVQDCIDLQFSTLVILHGIWSLVSEYRQLEFVLKIEPQRGQGNGNLISTFWYRELFQILDHFSMTVSGFDGGIPQEARILRELFMMNLHVSFEELQLLAGKEGSEEACRVYPLLRQWYDSGRSRQAIYYAGQILRAADLFPSSHLRDFYAVALYHSALCFWGYGMCSMGSRHSNRMQDHIMSGEIEEPVWLDGEETADTWRFIDVCRRIPMIRTSSRLREEGGGCRVDNPEAVMETVIHIMGKNCSHGSSVLPPLVENLAQLMRDLGNAGLIVRNQSLNGSLPGSD